MLTRHGKFRQSLWLMTSVLLVLVYCNQFSRLSHFHHEHDRAYAAVAFAADPLSADHGHDGHHHRPDDTHRSHGNDHDHRFEHHVKQQWARTLTTRVRTTANNDSGPPISFTLPGDEVDNDYSLSEEPASIESYRACRSLCRAPPITG